MLFFFISLLLNIKKKTNKIARSYLGSLKVYRLGRLKNILGFVTFVEIAYERKIYDGSFQVSVWHMT